MRSSLDPNQRVHVSREPQERSPLLVRLRRAEGQIRGVIDMIEADRYCGDELQQIAAARAALREVAILLATQHVRAAASLVATDRSDPDTVLADIEIVLRAAFRQD